ncbi:T9SS type A sorting domain-containing protein [Flavobacterium sp.]|uniref:T9SS type A sorting domain-containing protein n=1 Tax=Flavobacterium sp. TaxID=239 RepID=UPI0039E70B6E
MRKITLALALLFAGLQAEAQVLLSETFDTALNWTVTHVTGGSASVGWTRVTSGTNPSCTPAQGAGMAQFDAYNIAVGNNYSLVSPAIAFSGASYRVKFKMFRDGGYPTDGDRIRVMYNANPNTTGAQLLGTVNRSIALSPAVAEGGWYTYSFDLPANLNGNGHVIFLATSAYGNRIFIDDVTVSQIQENDAEMSSVVMSDIFATTGSTAITGQFKNMGANALTSVDLKWQVNDGTIHTQNLTGLNVTPGASYTYNHTDVWNDTPGENYNVKVWTENPNGTTDSDNTNNQVTKIVSVASNAATRYPLYEKFSSATCAPCASFNGGYFNGFFETNHDNFALINYQVNWPGAGDPYYTTEVGNRVTYYSVNAAPTLFIDSKDGTNFNTSLLQADLNAAMVRPAFFTMNASHILEGDNITVNVDVTPYLSGTYTLRAAVVEKVTTGNIATNGETEFHNVMMKMVPNAAGTTINCVRDVQQSVQVSASLDGTNVEEMEDLAVVVFIQSAGKSIMQSTYAVEALGNKHFDAQSAIKMYPNPTTGIVRISSATPVDVTVSDLTGKVIFTQNQVTSETAIDLSAFQTGIYLAKMSNGTSEQTQKIILK